MMMMMMKDKDSSEAILLFGINELKDKAKSLTEWLEKHNESKPDNSESSKLKHFLFYLSGIQMQYGQNDFMTNFDKDSEKLILKEH
jgi:hypothetical protein